MARARSGNTGFAVALVIFGCAFVIAALVAIIFYTKIEAAKAGEETAIEERRKYVSDSETGPANDFVSTDATVFANMRAEIQSLEKEVRDLSRNNTELAAKVETMETNADQLVDEKDDVTDRLNAEREQYASIMQERQEKIDALIREKDDLVAQVGDLQAKVTASIEDADAAARERIAELNQRVDELEAEMSEAQSQAANWEREYNQLAEQLPELPEDNTTLPDGEVASVFGDGKDMFITLGRRDGLVIGMTFEVYDPEPVIRLDTQGEARGKATIEVYSLDSENATCRVVRRDRGAKIDPGDPIVNLGYDPNMDIAMVAFGEFDIENDGGSNDIDRIKTLIANSGARLAELERNDDGDPVLTPDLDYIVLGKKPEVPEPPDSADFDPEAHKRYQEQLKRNEAYFRIVDDAKLLRIPVLNQNRFLQLTGYYQR